MRELYASELNSIYGAKTFADLLDYPITSFPHQLLAFSVITESSFLGYCGYHLAVSTGLISGPIGACIGFALLPLVIAKESEMI